MSAPGSVLVRTKLGAPATRAGLVPRARLDALLEKGLGAKLCLLDAPAGFGKTTLLAQWCTTEGEGRRVAWVSLDEGDNDPVRLWVYVVEAIRLVEPNAGAAALDALQRASCDLHGEVLPLLLNELGTFGSELILVLDDYHLVTNAACHRTLGFFVDRLPPDVHVVLSTRADPLLPLGRMRATGELAEIRAADLRFTAEEAATLLNVSMGLDLAPAEVEGLAERTEGWAAALYLAGLSLHGRQDAGAFLASFQGDHRHVADYLGAEVLARQPDAVRTFLLRTSILERLSGPLCDAVLETDDAAETLVELERANLFIVPLDERRQWYRYHHLFAELLRLELANRDAGLVGALHHRAAEWHRRAGNLEEAVHHATAAGEVAEAGALIAEHWLGYWRRGRLETVVRWLDELPGEALTTHPPLAAIASYVGGLRGASEEEVDRWLTIAEAGGDEGPLPAGMSSLEFGVALVRAMFVFGDVGRSLGAARLAVQLAGPERSPVHWMAVAVLGQALYLSGAPAEARPGLAELVRRVSASEQPYAVVGALALLSLVAGDDGDDATAAALAQRALALTEAQGTSKIPLSGSVYLALGRALARGGELAAAEEHLRQALELFGIDSMTAWRAHALLTLATVRHARGDAQGARALVEQVRALLAELADPGMLPVLLEQTERKLGGPPRRRLELVEALTERELAVLRLLPSELSQREIGRELYVSVNTVRTHVQAVYRKLDAATRAEAVERAHELGLLSRSSGPDR
jgi:LuxR family maltose regulon positive regulatory protein